MPEHIGALAFGASGATFSVAVVATCRLCSLLSSSPGVLCNEAVRPVALAAAGCALSQGSLTARNAGYIRTPASKQIFLIYLGVDQVSGAAE
jgi:hypothetical protein